MFANALMILALASPDPASAMPVSGAATQAAGSCWLLARPVDAGALIDTDMLETTACRDKAPRPALDYDRVTGAIRAGEAIEAGEYLGRLTLPRFTVDAGDDIILLSIAGPVRIERSVRALQPGRPGAPLFVADAEGNVFPIKLVDANQGTRR